MLKKTSIKVKILGVIALLAVVASVGLLHMSKEFWKTDVAYRQFISQEAMASLQTARASGVTVMAVLQVARASTLSPNTSQMLEASQTFDKYVGAAQQRLADVADLVPSRRSDAENIRDRLTRLKMLGHGAFAALNSGDERGAGEYVDKVYEFLDEVAPLFAANNEAMTKGLIKGSNALSDSTTSTIGSNLAILAIGILAAIAMSLVVAQAGITSPLRRLREQMISLADGNAAEEVSGLDRRDEIGKMAASVAVFRMSLIDRRRLEQQAEIDRSASAKDRLEREQEKAFEAASLQKTVTTLGKALGSLAGGDLTPVIDHQFVPELDSVRRDFNSTVSKLNDTLHTVTANACAIAAGSEQIRCSANSLATRTEKQAASVEETAAALEQITRAVKDAARRAKEASDLVSRTREGAERSGEVVRNAVDAMHRIEQSSNEISNIIGVIDDIAFQTNLLALNAGVEAARAGDAGKGFAVVAQEVRELAQRSARAAKEIKSLINTSGAQVEVGVTLVGDAGKVLQVIVSEVEAINQHMNAIAEASREQAVGLQEISSAVHEIDQGTQQNAAMVEETTAASHNLAIEATSLSNLMSQFKLGEVVAQEASVPNGIRVPVANNGFSATALRRVV
ncbi:methyl-accepting chemotaxis protein [Rhizobium leguminosarum]|uniref:methyl-accepting chemotaxis protein n=1 Tax=Rhizobium leguminosarum TaxID=384 RepID=UPI003F9B3B42